LRTFILLLGVAACGDGPDATVTRLLRHRLEAGEKLAGPGATHLGPMLGIGQDPSASLWVGPEAQRPGPPAAWARVPGSPDSMAVFRRRDALPAPSVAIRSLGGEPLDHPVFAEVLLHGPARPGGVLLAELAVRLPARTPVESCLALRVDSGEGATNLDLGMLHDGRHRHHPGSGEGPLTRARVLVPLPSHLPEGSTQVLWRLTHCVSGADLAPPAPWTVEIGGWGFPSDADLRARSGEPDPAASWPARPPPRPSLHRLADGTMETREGPPLPRVERGRAWGMLLTPPIDPSGWEAPSIVGSPGPLSGLIPLFDEADAAVLGLDAPATRAGRRLLVDPPPARRVLPEVLDWLPASGIDGVLGGPRAGDAGPLGREGSTAEARSRGLYAGDPLVLPVGEGDRAVSVALLHVRAEDLERRVTQARENLPGSLIFVQVEAAPDPDLPRRIAAVADAGMVLGPEAGGVAILDGVPIWLGVPVVGAADREALAGRWYVSPEGVQRLDIVPLVARAGRWERDTEGTVRGTLLEIASASLEWGTDLVVGRTIAAVDVMAHGPDRVAGPFRTVPPPPAPELPAPTGCPEPPEPQVLGTPLGGRLSLESAGRAGNRLRLVWRLDRPMDGAEVLLSSPDGAWKVRDRLCDGAWGMRELPSGTRALDEIDLLLLGPAPPPGPLLLQFKAGGLPLLPADGGRWITVPAR